MGAKCSRGEMGEYGNIEKKKKGEYDDAEEELEIEEVENGQSINELIREVNEVVAGWTENY